MMIKKFPVPGKLPKLIQFLLADRNRDGKLSLGEYFAAFHQGGFCGTGTVMQFRNLDRNKDGYLSFDEFAGNFKKPVDLKDLLAKLA